MRRSPVRVAVISESTIVREGLVFLIGQLGDRAIVVDTGPPDGRCGHTDVVVYDLGAAPGPTEHPELHRLAGIGVPMVALVHDGVATSDRVVDGPGGVGGVGAAPLVSLAVSAEELWEVLDRLVPQKAAAGGDRVRAGAPGLPGGLTHRELTVVTLIGAGLSNKEIAVRMFVSGNTIKTYIRTAYRKLGIRSRIHAALWAMEHGLVARPLHDHAKTDVVDPSPSTDGAI
jgi:DNA-binding CsgD family transcriptional regulator